MGTILLFVAVVVFLWLVSKAIAWGGFHVDEPESTGRVEKGYVIRDQETYEVFSVNERAYRKAGRTGCYDLLGRDISSSVRYTGPTPDGKWFDGVIPAGHILAGAKYRDERLN